MIRPPSTVSTRGLPKNRWIGPRGPRGGGAAGAPMGALTRSRSCRDAEPRQKRADVGVATQERPIESGGIVGVAAREDGAPETITDLAAEDPAFAEATERVGLQDLGPLVRVVTGGVAVCTAEE